jgi:photosystem II stability/assembly factor-like uncharacterized protein
MRAVFLAALAALLPARFAMSAEKPSFEDAPLHAVQFVDANEGWAVGDEGVVWHTIDGGKSWERQVTGVRASLRGIHFLNPYTGWIAGRVELPGGRSEGVVLATNSGGEGSEKQRIGWQRGLQGTVPGLNGVRFVRELEGYLYGDGSDQHPSGVYRTEDAGQTWHPVAGPRTTTWRSGWFTPTGEAALGGAWNRLASIKTGRVITSENDTLGGRAVTGLYFHGKQGLAVGQGGLILQSEGDLGSTWGFVELKGLDAVRPVWDLHAIHGVGEKVWAVGRPGSVVLHSPDMGKTWQVQRTGHSVPLNGVFFLDAKTGFAVGELGTILGTQDGGATWKLQHRGGQRAAVLSVNARAERIPLDTLATLGGADGYLSVALQVVAPDPASANLGRALQPYRTEAGSRLAGGAAGELLWAFPLAAHLSGTTKEDVLAAWNRLHGDRAKENLLAQMVLALRMWRPSLVLVDAPSATSGLTPAEVVVREVVAEALTKASDPAVCPEQLQVLGLEVWKPTKTYQQSTLKHDQGMLLVDTTEFAPLLGTTARDQANQASATLLGEEAYAPRTRAYQLVLGSAEAQKHTHLMQGIDLAHGGLARRTVEVVTEEALDLKKVVQQAATLQSLAENAGGELTDPNKLMGQLVPMLDKLPADLAARTATGIGGQLARSGQWVLAREVYALVVERYPAHPQAVVACRWLMQYHASSEARRRNELKQFIYLQSDQFGVNNGAQETIKVKQPGKKPDEPREVEVKVPKPENIHESAEATLTLRGEAQRWHMGALALEKALAAHGPLHYLDPALQMALLSAKRQLGDIDAARQGYALLASRQPEGPWKSAAQTELWLLNRTGEPPRPLITSRSTESRPILDGNLDEACWEAAKPVKLKNAVGEPAAKYPTEVRITHDREHLYVAIRCEQPAGKSVPPLRPRLHDQDMSGFDRVSIALDLERDYGTAFHFQVDQRGCLVEDCWGDRTWNPRWFVAQHHDETSWTTEMAIPLDGLTAQGITAGTVWGCNVIRVTPGVGIQALSLPAEAPEEALRVEGQGLLFFQDAPKQPR